MRVLALIHDVRMQSNLRSVLLPPYRYGTRARLEFATDWSELVDQAEDGLVDLAIIDPYAGHMASIPYQHLGRLRRVLGEGRVILYLSPQTLSPTLLRVLGKVGFRLMLTAVVDDDRISLERTLCVAASAVLFGQLRDHLRGRIHDDALDLLLDTLSSWSPGRNACTLARELRMDEAELRSLLAKSSLPTLRECLGWGRLFFAQGCLEVREETVSRLAYRLGYQDRSSLCRLCRRLTNRQATDLFSADGAKIIIGALVRRLAS